MTAPLALLCQLEDVFHGSIEWVISHTSHTGTALLMEGKTKIHGYACVHEINEGLRTWLES